MNTTSICHAETVGIRVKTELSAVIGLKGSEYIPTNSSINFG